MPRAPPTVPTPDGMAHDATPQSAGGAPSGSDTRARPASGADARARAPLREDDLRLARGCLAGSAAARREFARRMAFVPRVLALRNGRLSRPFSADDLDDLVQDTLVAIWRRLDSFEGKASLETWAYRFCQFQVANRLRARGRLPRQLAPDTDREEGAAAATVLDYDDLYRALERLPAADADVVRIKHFRHRTFEEIAADLSISPNTAKSRYYRGLERLKELLASSREERLT